MMKLDFCLDFCSRFVIILCLVNPQACVVLIYCLYETFSYSAIVELVPSNLCLFTYATLSFQRNVLLFWFPSICVLSFRATSKIVISLLLP